MKPSKQDLAGFPGYHFGLDDETIEPVRKTLEGLAGTGADGKADVKIALPSVPKTARPLEADVILKLREQSGRIIERAITLPVDMGEARIGIKPLFADQRRRRKREGRVRGRPARRGRQGRRPRKACSGNSCASKRRGSGTAATAAGPMSRRRSRARSRTARSILRPRAPATHRGRYRLRPLSPRGPLAGSRRPGLQRRLQCRLVRRQ